MAKGVVCGVCPFFLLFIYFMRNSEIIIKIDD
jgi:hypothetical protein